MIQPRMHGPEGNMITLGCGHDRGQHQQENQGSPLVLDCKQADIGKGMFEAAKQFNRGCKVLPIGRKVRMFFLADPRLTHEGVPRRVAIKL